MCASVGVLNPTTDPPDVSEPRMVTFRDSDPWYKADETGMNKVGYITCRQTVIHPLRRRVVETPIRKVLKKRRCTLFTIDSAYSKYLANIETFFTQNRPSVGLFFMGQDAIVRGEFSFFDDPVRLPILRPILPSEREVRWEQFVSQLRPADIVAVFDTQSLMSKLITHLDQGTWSHTALYVGGGKVTEAITAGVVERPIEVYRSSRYRLGIYRASLTELQAELLVAASRTIVGRHYSFYKATRLGIMMALGTRRNRTRSKNVSPNDIARSGTHKPIFFV
jgi:hypothetical protein